MLFEIAHPYRRVCSFPKKMNMAVENDQRYECIPHRGDGSNTKNAPASWRGNRGKSVGCVLNQKNSGVSGDSLDGVRLD